MNPLLQIVPYDQSLTTQNLGMAFKEKSASYKFYWFISILQCLQNEKRVRLVLQDPKNVIQIPVDEIVWRMIANAWHPISFCKLSFGKSDSMPSIVEKIQEITGLDSTSKMGDVIATLDQYKEHPEVKKMKRTLLQNVPYRFLSPWFPKVKDSVVVERSNAYEKDCLYALQKDEYNKLKSIKLNPRWNFYLLNNNAILEDFAYRNLINFLQSRNPNVPNISNKLVYIDNRQSLKYKRELWKPILEYAQQKSQPLHCIYTEEVLDINKYDLDHFMPWSFVMHNLLWNLVPANPSINSSKSNCIPDLSYFLPKLVDTHFAALEMSKEMNLKSPEWKDFETLGFDVSDLFQMSHEQLFNAYSKTFSPMSQIALNMGFEKWSYHE